MLEWAKLISGGATMSAVLKQVIENIEELTSSEKALVAHCLISSLEIKHDESVDNAWAELAEKRFSELEAGVVKGVSWSEIRNRVTG
jgi:hypothetical protein